MNVQATPLEMGPMQFAAGSQEVPVGEGWKHQSITEAPVALYQSSTRRTSTTHMSLVPVYFEQNSSKGWFDPPAAPGVLSCTDCTVSTSLLLAQLEAAPV